MMMIKANYIIAVDQMYSINTVKVRERERWKIDWGKKIINQNPLNRVRKKKHHK